MKSRLIQIGLSDLEASIYLTLVRQGASNGSQIGKILNIPRTSIYSALDSLCQKGAVTYISDDRTTYKAEDPQRLIKNWKNTFNQAFVDLEKHLPELQDSPMDDHFWNLKGGAGVEGKLREFMDSAEKEILIAASFTLKPYRKELQQAIERGVRIIVFSFCDLGISDLKIESYRRKSILNGEGYRRLQMVVDLKRTLVASATPEGEFIGTFTTNRLMTSLAAEHIHHDIYLLELEKKLGKDPISKELLLGTLLEKQYG